MSLKFLLLLMFILLFTSYPVGLAMALATLLYCLLSGQIDPIIIMQRMYVGISSFSLMAIPFFVMAGAFMNLTGITQALVAVANTLVGFMRGALAHISIVTNMFFAGISGSQVADCTAVSSVLIPAMKKSGYSPAFSAAVNSAASTIGPIIPPSVHMLIFASLVSISTGKLFMGGAIPGIVMGVFLIITTYIIARRRNLPREPRPSAREATSSIIKGLPAFILPLIIIGGIVGGLFTPAEAGAVAVAASTLIGIMWFKKAPLKDWWEALSTTVLSTGQIMLAIGMATSFGWVLTAEGAPRLISNFLMSISTEPNTILLLIAIMYLICGLFLEPTPLMVMTVPLLYPLVQQVGINPIHWGVVTVMSVLVGQSTPPVGLCMYITCSIAECDVISFVREALPYFVAMILLILIVIFLPGIVLYLPSLM